MVLDDSFWSACPLYPHLHVILASLDVNVVHFVSGGLDVSVVMEKVHSRQFSVNA